jgi:hypothetical protein
MHYFVFLHIVAMFAAVSIAYGPMFLLRRAASTRHVPTIRGVFGLARNIGRAAAAMFGIGFILGVVAIFTDGYDPFAPWLIIAYVLFVLTAVTGARISGPWVEKVAELANASPDAAASTQLREALDEPLPQMTFYADLAVIVLILFDMVIKPFS